MVLKLANRAVVTIRFEPNLRGPGYVLHVNDVATMFGPLQDLRIRVRKFTQAGWHIRMQQSPQSGDDR